MNDLIPFSFDNKDVRVVNRNGDPWFVLADLCRVLELENPSMTVKALDEDERAKFNLGRQGDALIVSESGFYTIVLRSRDAVVPGSVAHRFRRWVTNEVLPTIRKSGRYDARQPEPGTGPTQTERQARLALDQITEIRMTFGVPAARAAWRKLGLVQVGEMDPSVIVQIPTTDRVIQAIREYGGMVTRTTLGAQMRRYMTTEEFDAALTDLVETGLIEVRRPSRRGQGRRLTIYRMAA